MKTFLKLSICKYLNAVGFKKNELKLTISLGNTCTKSVLFMNCKDNV
jgi:hypothetical protein